MPFVQFLKEKVESSGLDVLNLTSDVDEVDVLSKNKDYLVQTLNVSRIPDFLVILTSY